MKNIIKRLIQLFLVVLFFWISIFTYASWFWELMYRGDGDYDATYAGWVFQNYNLTLPKISLSESGTYTYVAAGLQTNRNPHVLLWIENIAEVSKQDLDVEVSVRIKDGNGKLFYEVHGPLNRGKMGCGLSHDEYKKFRETYKVYWSGTVCNPNNPLSRNHFSYVTGYWGGLDWSWWETYKIEVTVTKPSKKYPELTGQLKILSGWK